MSALMELRIYQEDAALLETISLYEPAVCDPVGMSGDLNNQWSYAAVPRA